MFIFAPHYKQFFFFQIFYTRTSAPLFLITILNRLIVIEGLPICLISLFKSVFFWRLSLWLFRTDNPCDLARNSSLTFLFNDLLQKSAWCLLFPRTLKTEGMFQNRVTLYK